MAKHLLIGFLASLGLLSCSAQVSSPTPEPVSLIAGGDVVWSQRVRLPDYYFGAEDKSALYSEDGWRRLPFAATPQSKAFLEKTYGRQFATDKAHFKTAIQFDLAFVDDKARLAHPFAKISKVLQREDLAIVNLESPLSDNGRLSGAFRAPEAFANNLRKAGVDIVSTANNHAFDAEGEGLSDTLRALQSADILPIGTGVNLREATRAKIVEIKGQKFAFLAFTYGVNPTSTSLGFATDNRSGAAPLDPFLIEQAIKGVRNDVDFVIVSLHWGLENKADVHPSARTLAHAIIDKGADVILGHHPHIPRGVETYNNGLIAYSLGNFVFGHSHANWEDNFLLRLEFEAKKLSSAEIIPIAGTGADITQPYILQGARAQATLQTLKERSAALGTGIAITEARGIVLLDK